VLSGVEPQALRWAYDVAAKKSDSRLAGSRLEIETVPLVVWCAGCQAEQPLENLAPLRLRCPSCSAPTPRIVRGRELEILAVELADVDSGSEAEANANAAATVAS
jgi:hydrogenase nickel incorporation protein HypA/HybF